MDALAKYVITLLQRIETERFYQSERGYQGHLLGLLAKNLSAPLLPDGAIVEQEHQKRLNVHGNQLRPDIIIHRPAEKDGNPKLGNFVLIALKRRARVRQARADFVRLDRFFTDLDYRVGIFINIDSRETHADHYRGAYPHRLYCVSVCRENNRTRVALDRPEETEA